MLKSLGHDIDEATSDRVAVRLMERTNIDLVLAGVDPLDGDALELLSYVRRKHREVPVILLFPRLHPERAKEAYRSGAMAVLKYPVPAAELRAAVMQALERSEARPAAAAGSAPATSSPVARSTPPTPTAPPSDLLSTAPPRSEFSSPANSIAAVPASNSALTQALPASAHSHTEQLARDTGLIGNDPGWRQVIELAITIAPTRASVLITGEPGTGKSLLARLIHSLGPNADRPFITLEGSVVAEGHSMDENATPAPTNGSLDWPNKLAQARGGTLYLNEVAALPLELQLHLLRELQFRDFEACAGHPAPPGEPRFLMSTCENLTALIEQGRFRQELYHRISVISLMLPPLRHRGTDVELLAESFRAHYAHEFHKTVAGFTRDALDVLQRHDWPGNVRELEAAIQRAVALCNGPRITSNHLAPILNRHRQSRSSAGNPPRPHLKLGVRPLKEALEEPEKRIIIQALQAFNWNRQETARVLDINRTTLYKKMKKYNLLIDQQEPAWMN
jgi:two-component system response regulator HydG